MAAEQPGTVPAVDSASVVLLRDGPPRPEGGGNVEVLLLERHLDSDFAGGAYVFPGGKVDAADRELDPARWTGRALTWWQPRLGAATPQDALGLLVCAVRETFEEAGILLAAREDGQPLTGDDLSQASFREARQRLSDRSQRWDWRGWLEDEALTLDLGCLALWSWWVTPEGQHRRFDTRFFVTPLPAQQVAAHDRIETTALVWTRPEDALAEQARGSAVIIFPTRRNLQALRGHPSAQVVWEAALTSTEPVPRIQPTIVMVEGRPMVQHPHESDPSPV